MDDQTLVSSYQQVVHLLHRYYARQRLKEGATYQPHHGQGRVLMLLSMQSEISQKELAYLLAIRPQSLSELLDKLEDQALIYKRTSKEDRRMSLIGLTDQGKARVLEMKERGKDTIAIFSCLTEEEKECLYHVSQKVIDALNDALEL